MFITSAPRRLPASSNEACVRVEGSKEKVDLRASPQGRLLLLHLPADLDSLVGEIEQGLDVERRKPLDAEQVAMRKNGACACHLEAMAIRAFARSRKRDTHPRRPRPPQKRQAGCGLHATRRRSRFGPWFPR